MKIIGFKEFLAEGQKYKSKGAATKAIKKVIANTVELLDPQAFEVENKNTDAGMGGYNYFQITPRSTRSKDMNDIENVKKALEALIKKDMDDMVLSYDSKTHIMVIKPKGNVNESKFVDRLSLEKTLSKVNDNYTIIKNTEDDSFEIAIDIDDFEDFRDIVSKDLNIKLANKKMKKGKLILTFKY